MSKRDMILDKIGANLRAVRESMNISGEEMGENINVHYNTIYSIERGERTGENLVRYVYWLFTQGVDVNILFHIKEEKP